MNSISVVIPVFNAEPNLRELVGQLIPQLEAVAKEFEIALVDDLSVVQKIPLTASHAAGVAAGRGY